MTRMSRRDAEARREREALWGRKKQDEVRAVMEKELARNADAAKTASLRKLRLAKEAADKEADSSEINHHPLKRG